jgi:uncharacterized FlaG/YvyC family protein
MNTYSWIQPPSSSSLTLQKDGNAILQVTKDGGLVSNFALFTSLPEDKESEGNVLVVDQSGLLRKSPMTLKKISSDINDYFKMINEEINNSLAEVQKEDEKAMNKIVADLNNALTTIQNNNKYEISQTAKTSDSKLSRIQSLERMLWIMFVLIILLLLAVIRLFLKK